MPIISHIRKGSRWLKAQVFFIYLVLTLGAVTMVYPFLIMVSGSFKSVVDSTDFDIVPAYFYNEELLLKKYAEARYDGNILLYNCSTGAGVMNFTDITAPASDGGKLLQEWDRFIEENDMPVGYYRLGQTENAGFMPLMRWKFIKHVEQHFKGDLEAYNREFNSTAVAWFYINAPFERFFEKSYVAEYSPAYKAFVDFKQRQERWHRIYTSVENNFRYGFLSLKYGTLVDDYNKLHGTSYKSYSQIPLSETVPVTPGPERDDWIEFTRSNLNRIYIEALPNALGPYRDMLKRKYENDIARLNKSYGREYASFDQVVFPSERGVSGAESVDYDQFVMIAPPEYLRLAGPDIRFRHHLLQKYGDLQGINRALGTSYASIAAVGIPALEYDWSAVRKHRRDIRWEFISRNYKMVLSYILLQGRGIFNTTVYVLLAIGMALTINPISAYALSRFNLPSTFKILLFMMATMAFPAAVTMIPNFLLLKQMHLLNTFWALVLPGMANGYSIFLLKGFFDSLPRELYEACMIDGANEWTMFWKITMSLSKPILAVIALAAFTSAYGAFMYAFTVCQDQSMWTLMVWLFKLQQTTHMSVTFAALIVAAVPTLVVFILSQNVIMRGIIVPQEK